MSEYTAEVFRRSAERMDRRRRIRKRVLSCFLVCFLALGVCLGSFEIRKLFANEMPGDTVEMPGDTVSPPPELSTDAREKPPVVITAEAPDVYGVVESEVCSIRTPSHPLCKRKWNSTCRRTFCTA